MAEAGTNEMAQQVKKKKKESGKEKVACFSKGKKGVEGKPAQTAMWVCHPHKLARKICMASLVHP